MAEEPNHLPEPAAEESSEISLDQLSRSFARLFGGQSPAESGGPAPDAVASTDPAEAHDEPSAAMPDAEPAAEEDPFEVTPGNLLEAMLFVGSPGNEPLSAERAAGVMRGVAPEEVHELVAELNRQYAANRCPYVIQSEGAGYRLVLREQYHGLRDRFHGRVRQARLSQAAIDVLAIVAYNQPLTAEEVSRLRSTPSGPMLNQLVRRRLLRIQRSEEQPKATRYATTERFLQLFGLESLEDLPQSQDLD